MKFHHYIIVVCWLDMENYIYTTVKILLFYIFSFTRVLVDTTWSDFFAKRRRPIECSLS